MGQITIDQSHQIVATLVTNTAWKEVDFEGAGLQNLVVRDPEEAGRQFTAFLKNGGRMGIVGKPKIILIDRAWPFNPVKLLDSDWTIDEQDERALALDKIDLAEVRLEHVFKENETRIEGKERLKRLKKAGHIRLDAAVFLKLWENQELIPESWKEQIGGQVMNVCFDGTIFRDPDGRRWTLYLFWYDGRWCWSCFMLGLTRDVSCPSAIYSPLN